MKKLLKTSVALAFMSSSALFGCLGVDDNEDDETLACIVGPITAQHACEERGLTFVAGCLDESGHTDCQEVTFLKSGD